MPTTRTVTETLYQFDELSDTAKDNARDWYRNGMESDDFGFDCILDDASRIGAMIGIEINTRPVKLMGGGTRQDPNVYWSCNDDGRDYVSISGSYSYAKGGVGKVASECPESWVKTEYCEAGESESNREVNRIARELQECQRKHFYGITADLNHARESTDVSVSCGHGCDEWKEDFSDVEQLLTDFADWILSSMKVELRYRYSDESVDESIRANEYTFDENGRRA